MMQSGQNDPALVTRSLASVESLPISPHMMVVLGTIFFGAAEILSKHLITSYPVSNFIFLRNAGMVFVFGVSSFFSEEVFGLPFLEGKSWSEWMTWGPLFFLVLSALTGPVIGRSFFSISIRELGLTRAVLLHQMKPIFVALFAAVLLQEMLSIDCLLYTSPSPRD